MKKNTKKRKYYPEELFAAFLMGLMVLLCFINICARFIFKVSMVTTDQLLLSIWPCVIFLGAPVCCTRKTLTAFTLISDRFSPDKQKWFELITTIAGLLTFGFLFYYGSVRAYNFYVTNYRITTLFNCPMWILALIIPIGSALYIVRTIQVSIEAFRGVPVSDESSLKKEVGG